MPSPTLIFIRGYFASELHYTLSTEERFWDLNLRITGSTSFLSKPNISGFLNMVSLTATWLHCSRLYGDEPARNDQPGGKSEQGADG